MSRVSNYTCQSTTQRLGGTVSASSIRTSLLSLFAASFNMSTKIRVSSTIPGTNFSKCPCANAGLNIFLSFCQCSPSKVIMDSVPMTGLSLTYASTALGRLSIVRTLFATPSSTSQYSNGWGNRISCTLVLQLAIDQG